MEPERFAAAADSTPRGFGAELRRQLGAIGRIEAAGLADLFRHVEGDAEHVTVLGHVLQDFLLTRTVDHARQHTAYYRDSRYADWMPGASDSPTSLDDLPVLRRDVVVEHFGDFLADDVRVRSVCHTSGTTGPKLYIYKSFEEIQFIQAYYRHLFQPLAESLDAQPLVLTLPNLYHGVPVPLPGIGMSFVSGVTDDTLIDATQRLLQETFRLKGYDNRVSMLSGLSHHVLLLTSYLVEHGINPRDLPLKGVTVTGSFVPSHWYQHLVDAWGCVVNDRYTLTEVIGGASRIHGTDVFILDPHIFGEVVDPDTGRQTDDPVGLLVLTNLYPFVQMQPLIRYAIGDLVRRVTGPGMLRFQYLGKEKNCISWVRDGRREWLMFSARLNELVAQFPDCNINNEWYSNIREIRDQTVGLLPALSLTSREEGNHLLIRVAVELRYGPHRWPARVEELKRMITAGLRNTPNTALAARLDCGDVVLDVAFVGPGELKAPLGFKI